MKPPTRVPRPLLVPSVLAGLFLALPLIGLLQRAPWSTVYSRLGDSTALDALRVSAIVSVCAAGLCFVLGLPAAWVLARVDFRFQRLVRTIVILPMVLPPVVGGTALLFALGRRGLAGQWLERWFGITLPFTTAGAVVAATFVALPFFITTVEAGLRQAGTGAEEAASVFGAGPWTTFWRITIPQIWPAVGAGLALAWARALGEFGATITFAGNAAGRSRTLPVEVFLARESDPETAVAISLVLLAVSFTVLMLLRERWLWR